MNDVTFSEVGMCVLQLANLVICEILEKVAVLSIATSFLANGGVVNALQVVKKIHIVTAVGFSEVLKLW